MRSPILVCMVSLLFAVASAQVRAQEEGVEEQPVTVVEVQPDERIPEGKSAFYQGETDQAGHRFAVGGTDLTQPVAITVLTRNADDRVRVRVVKSDWDEPDRDETTGADKRVDFRFRTFDQFKLWVTADQPTEYQLVVWVGEPNLTAVPAIAVPASRFVEPAGDAATRKDAAGLAPVPTRAGAMSFSVMELGLLMALVLLGAAFLAYILMRRNARRGA